VHGGHPLYLSTFHPRYKPDPRHPERPLHPSYVLFLHAGFLRFFHPLHQKALTIEAAPSQHFQIALRQLRKYSLLSPSRGRGGIP
jgi:hypothetical protein